MSTTVDSGTAQPYPALPNVATRGYERSKRLRRIGHIVLIYGLALPGAIMFILPFLWMFSTSLKASNEIFISRSRYWLVKEYPIKLRHCVNALPPAAVWARPNASSNRRASSVS